VSEGYRTFDHTGDLGLEVWAETPERLHALAAEALLALTVEARTSDVDVRHSLLLTGDDPVDLLIHWLNTALLRAENEHAVWTRVTVKAVTPQSIEATLEGPRLDPRRDVRLREIKAVSHHDMELELEPPRCRCRLVLDI
jgi:SHS2 domain-containing protein